MNIEWGYDIYIDNNITSDASALMHFEKAFWPKNAIKLAVHN